MKVFKSVDLMRQWSTTSQLEKNTIALVPTMGYLHDGHIELIRKVRKTTDKVVVSIFVNPTQFGEEEDLDTYPADLKRDLDICKKENVDAVFNPAKEEMYHPDFQTYVENQKIGHILCGKSRPVHFRGVTTIVSKLFNIISPDVAVFGQKDAQQAIIIKNMVRDLNFKTSILLVPIIREQDGLAMSSRNKYLSDTERKQALVLSQCIRHVQQQFKNGNKDLYKLKNEITERISALDKCRIDYVEFVDADTLQKIPEKGNKVLLALAVFVGTTRLIDNIILYY